MNAFTVSMTSAWKGKGLMGNPFASPLHRFPIARTRFVNGGALMSAPAKCFVLILALIAAAGAHSATSLLTQGDAQSIRSVIEAQLAAFSADDAEKAFSFASECIQRNLRDGGELHRHGEGELPGGLPTRFGPVPRAGTDRRRSHARCADVGRRGWIVARLIS